jgi:uncharacterized protein (TIRG00374 family)
MSASSTTTSSAPYRRLLLGSVISVLTLAGVVWWTTQQEAPELPSSASALTFIGLACTAYISSAVARGWRWHVILRWARIRHETVDAFALIAVAHMGNTVLFARGGEVLRILLMAERSSARKRELIGTFVTERLLDGGTLVLLFALVSFVGVANSSTERDSAIVALVVLGLAVISGFVYLRLRVAGRFERFAGFIRPLARSSRPLFSTRGVGLATVTAGLWLSEGLVFWLVTQALQLQVSATEAMFVTLLASFAGMLPSAPGYAGTLDAAVLFGLNTVGVAGGAAIACLLLYRFVVFVPLTVVGFGVTGLRYGGLRSLFRRS